MEQEIIMVLEPEEKVVWQGVINRKIMMFYLVLSLIVIITLSFLFFSQETISYTSNKVPKNITGSTIGIFLFMGGVFLSLISFLSHYVTKYIITNKRVLIKSGLIGIDFNSIYFTEVKTVKVSVGLIDKIFSVGTISIDTGKIETINKGRGNNKKSRTQTTYDKLLHISNQYEVYKYFQTSLTERQESLYSGRADRENNPTAYNNN